ncbi:lactate dehydrogenase [Enterococcus florum]|uniref:Lactate dehydrogenase n=1 Tax=Enterococcus florum TaxID=2480627 RepID=A0A4P5PEK3_9ENTE|nr:NAD(P)-dependent oxidoreductase [Enterococcus florum]GCF94062.1 lactate dehydrogenase [Enterococcus florum]
MKLIFYGVTDVEIPFIHAWSTRTKVPVTIVRDALNRENVEMARQHDGICLYPSQEMRESPFLYRRLAEYGMKHLSIKSTGVDGVNFEWAGKYGLAVTNVPSYSPTSVGHFAVMSVLMLLRNIPDYLHSSKLTQNRQKRIGKELSEVTVGVLGTGRIGSVVAQSLKALGATVIACSRKPHSQLAAAIDYVSFEEMMEKSDIISIHIPLMKESEYLFSADAFAKMKKGAMLVNTARGKIIDTEALISALEAGDISGAALDTLEDEENYFAVGYDQNPFYQRLKTFETVIMTPHIAYYTDQAVKEITETVLDNAVEMAMGNISENLVVV